MRYLKTQNIKSFPSPIHVPVPKSQNLAHSPAEPMSLFTLHVHRLSFPIAGTPRTCPSPSMAGVRSIETLGYLPRLPEAKADRQATIGKWTPLDVCGGVDEPLEVESRVLLKELVWNEILDDFLSERNVRQSTTHCGLTGNGILLTL